MTQGPYRHGAKILNSATVITEWEGSVTGQLDAVVLHSLNLGAATISIYILPPGVVAVAHEYIIGPKAISIPVGMSLDLEIRVPYPLNKGDTVVAVASAINSITASAVTSEWERPA